VIVPFLHILLDFLCGPSQACRLVRPLPLTPTPSEDRTLPHSLKVPSKNRANRKNRELIANTLNENGFWAAIRYEKRDHLACLHPFLPFPKYVSVYLQIEAEMFSFSAK